MVHVTRTLLPPKTKQGIFEVWAESDSLDGLLAALREMVDVPGGGPVGPYRKREDGRSWRYAVESFGKKMTFDQANDFFKELDFLGIEGKVDLANASDVFTLIKAERDPDGGLPDSFPTRCGLSWCFYGALTGASERFMADASGSVT